MFTHNSYLKGNYSNFQPAVFTIPDQVYFTIIIIKKNTVKMKLTDKMSDKT